MSANISKKLRNQRKDQYINKTFDEFRGELLNYARSNFSNQIQDFSESSLGGMLLDFASIVGDSLTYYVDQQMNELNYENAVNTENIISHLRRAGVKGGGATAASVNVSFFIEVDIDDSAPLNSLQPLEYQLPVVKAGTALSSVNGINFILAEDVDFGYGYEKEVAEVDDNGTPQTLILKKKGLCTSGDFATETVSFPADDQGLFLSYNLQNPDIQKITSVLDSDLNEYFEVDFLSQNTVYLKVENAKEKYFYPTVAPFRYTIERNFLNSTSAIRFGNGSGKTIEDNLLTNPEDFILPLKHRSYDSNVSIDPGSLLTSNSLGVSPAGKTVTIQYVHGGGVSHNVPEESIETVIRPLVVFPYYNLESPPEGQSLEDITDQILESLDVLNEEEAVGGSNSLSLEEMRNQIPNAITMQNRIVNQKDLISRIYTMPSDFGKVHKVAVLSNEYTNLAKDIFVICRNQEGQYVYANDALKINLKNYIDEHRVLGDSFNIIDAPIFNFGIDLTLKIKSNYTIEEVLDNVISRIVQNMRFETLQINEAINVNDIINVTLNTPGVSSIVTLPENIITSKSFQDDFFDDEEEIDIEYARNSFSPQQQFQDGFIFPNRGGIFELKHLDFDIVVRNGWLNDYY